MHLKFIDKELLLFDLDGTLIDSAPDLALSINFMLRSVNREEFSSEVIDTWVGNGAPMLVKRAISGNKTIFLEYYKENSCVATEVYPNVVDTLKTLQKHGYKMAVITNKPFEFIEPILEFMTFFISILFL